MLRKLVLAGFILASLFLAAAVQAQGPEPQHSDPRWQVSYWNNMSLSGVPVVEETVEYLSRDWGEGSPHPSVNADHFSARWSRYLDLAEATYRFAAKSDDGIRVYVDDRLIIDQWNDHPARTFTSDLALEAGHHRIVVEYYENAGVAVAGLSWAPISAGSGQWQGEYFSNGQLSGSPVLVRADASIDFDWGAGSPGPVVPSDGFSARWTRLVHLDNGRYRFTATSDDGVRVYVDQRLIIDEWNDHPVRVYAQEVDLNAGDHLVVVEYYENGGLAVAKLSWALSTGSGAWQGEYFSNRWLDGSPALVRSEAEIDFDWGYGSPSAVIPSDGFSARWTRTASFESGTYRFTTATDDGVRLWVNGHLLVDAWQDQALASHSGTIFVTGQVPIKIEYYENGGVAAARLTWTRADSEPPSTGEVVVDDGDPGFAKGGSVTAWHAEAGGHDGSYVWTRNNDRARSDYNWVRWYADLEPGRYEVFAYIPDDHATTSSARYWVAHYDGYTLRRVDQAANAGRWVSLGTYRFRSTGHTYVSLSDVTYEPYLSRQIAFDAIKWVPR